MGEIRHLKRGKDDMIKIRFRETENGPGGEREVGEC